MVQPSWVAVTRSSPVRPVLDHLAIRDSEPVAFGFALLLDELARHISELDNGLRQRVVAVPHAHRRPGLTSCPEPPRSPLRRGVLRGCASSLFTASMAFTVNGPARHSLMSNDAVGFAAATNR